MTKYFTKPRHIQSLWRQLPHFGMCHREGEWQKLPPPYHAESVGSLACAGDGCLCSRKNSVHLIRCHSDRQPGNLIQYTDEPCQESTPILRPALKNTYYGIWTHWRNWNAMETIKKTIMKEKVDNRKWTLRIICFAYQLYFPMNDFNWFKKENYDSTLLTVL